MTQARNKFALRGGKLAEGVSGVLGTTTLITGEGAPPIADQLRDALSKNLARVIDLFRDWDDNGDGCVSKAEFRRAMPMLGLQVAAADADALFDSFDADKGGTLEYGEISKQLKPRRPAGFLPKVKSAPRLGGASGSGASPLRSGADEYKDALAAEQAAKRRLARIQKELMRSVSTSAIEARKEENLLVGRQVRDTTTGLRWGGDAGRQFAAKIANTSPASDEEVRELALLFYKQMKSIFGGPSEQRLWYKLYLFMDTDRSGRISFDELSKMVRSNLQMDRQAMPAGKLKRLWRALDTDASGFIDAGEFGRFMKKGEDATEAVTLAKQKLLERRSKETQALRKEMDARIGRDLNSSLLAGVEAASDDQVAALAEQINGAMAQLLPKGTERAWIKLFKLLDEDGSGRLSFGEFTKMIRLRLNLSEGELSEERLKAVWKAVDTGAEGFISVGSFGRFIKKGASALLVQSAALETEDETNRRRRMAEEAAALKRLAAKQEEEERMRAAARQRASLAKQIELDAVRLEAELKRLSKKAPTQKPLTGLRRLPATASGPSIGDAASPLPGASGFTPQSRSHVDFEARTLDFQPRVGYGVDF